MIRDELIASLENDVLPDRVIVMKTMRSMLHPAAQAFVRKYQYHKLNRFELIKTLRQIQREGCKPEKMLTPVGNGLTPKAGAITWRSILRFPLAGTSINADTALVALGKDLNKLKGAKFRIATYAGYSLNKGRPSTCITLSYQNTSLSQELADAKRFFADRLKAALGHEVDYKTAFEVLKTERVK